MILSAHAVLTVKCFPSCIDILDVVIIYPADIASEAFLQLLSGLKPISSTILRNLEGIYFSHYFRHSVIYFTLNLGSVCKKIVLLNSKIQFATENSVLP